MTDAPNDAGDLKPAAKAWLLPVTAPDKPVALAGAPATIRGGVAWSADGSEIAFAAQTPEDAPPGVEELYALRLPTAAAMRGMTNAATVPRRLMAGFDGGLGYGQPVFLADGKVLAPVAQGTRLGAVKLAIEGSSAPEPVVQQTPIMTGLATNPKQTGWVWMAEGSDHPPTLCYATRLGDECTAVGTPALSPKPIETVKTELIHWQNAGLTIEGLLSLPPEARKGHKVPLIVEVHGGPLGAWEDRYDPWVSFLLGYGWAILRPNPRGSSGYGAKFAAANHNDLGGEDFRDIMSGVDEVVQSYSVNPDRMALMGYSYGGEIASFAEGKTDRFKAIISGAPVIDQFSEYGTEHGSWYDRWYYGLPWEHFADAWRQSPLSGAAQARTPFLLLQGQADVTDPLGQSEEMYRALRQMGAPVELVTYPREDHGPLARGIFGYPSPEPWHGFDARQRIVEFLDRNLGTGTGAKQ
uniref:Putative Acylaminoacyl-peptidase n=1 Tax=mine drainage metagenome TaxID=410659 RepID=E6PXB9_9ZZZZ